MTVTFSAVWEQPGRREPYVFTIKRGPAGRWVDHVRSRAPEAAERLRGDMIALYQEQGWTVVDRSHEHSSA